ncbi:hypothetical protein ACNTMW_15465 [Planosporangium sp. 12N6]|uniref:hypothetical protein n=1 Tax=Planosporangium spinosum TaxID=3402278 RepID=UPI003CE7F2AE
MTADPAPFEHALSTVLEYDLRLDEDDGKPTLAVRDGQTVVARISGSDDHDETLAGIRKLVNGLWLLQTAVVGQKYQQEHQAHGAADESAAVDSDGQPEDLGGTGPDTSTQSQRS